MSPPFGVGPTALPAILARSGRFPPFCGKPPAARMATTRQAFGGRWPLRSIHSLRLSLCLHAPPPGPHPPHIHHRRRLRRPACKRSSRFAESLMLPRLANSPASRHREIRHARDPNRASRRNSRPLSRSGHSLLAPTPPRCSLIPLRGKTLTPKTARNRLDARTPGMSLSSVHCRTRPSLSAAAGWTPTRRSHYLARSLGCR